MRALSRRVELPLDMPIERPHHAYPGEHRWAAALGNKQKRLHRGLPSVGIVFGLGELGDVEGGVAEGDEYLAFRQFNWIEELLVPRQDSPRPTLGYPAAFGSAACHTTPPPPVKTINQLDLADPP